MARPQVSTRLVEIKHRLVCGKADCLTNFNPIWPRQRIYSSTTKKSASVRQPQHINASAERESVFPKPRPPSFVLDKLVISTNSRQNRVCVDRLRFYIPIRNIADKSELQLAIDLYVPLPLSFELCFWPLLRPCSMFVCQSSWPLSWLPSLRILCVTWPVL